MIKRKTTEAVSSQFMRRQIARNIIPHWMPSELNDRASENWNGKQNDEEKEEEEWAFKSSGMLSAFCLTKARNEPEKRNKLISIL